MHALHFAHSLPQLRALLYLPIRNTERYCAALGCIGTIGADRGRCSGELHSEWALTIRLSERQTLRLSEAAHSHVHKALSLRRSRARPRCSSPIRAVPHVSSGLPAQPIGRCRIFSPAMRTECHIPASLRATSPARGTRTDIDQATTRGPQRWVGIVSELAAPGIAITGSQSTMRVRPTPSSRADSVIGLVGRCPSPCSYQPDSSQPDLSSSEARAPRARLAPLRATPRIEPGCSPSPSPTASAKAPTAQAAGCGLVSGLHTYENVHFSVHEAHATLCR